ncbi:MAG: hypothetical protein H7Y17_04680 [Chlorobia bacterium]|nr:hypothetical protein [Fimbriimonadaceae bacterium]
MNVINLLAAKTPSPDLGGVLQNYWVAFAAVPCVLLVLKVAKSRRRQKTYRW